MANKKDITKKKKGEIIREAKISSVSKDKELISNKNYKAFIWLVGMVLLALIIFFIYSNYKASDTTQTSKNFKQEYEQWNGKKYKNQDTYINLEIEEENIIQYVNYEKIFSVLERGTAVIYFGDAKNQQCRDMISVLLEASNETGLDTIYYLNPSSERDQKKLDENKNIITEKEGSKNYYKLLERLENIAESYEGLENPQIKRLYLPTILFVKDGEIIDAYLGLTDSKQESYTKMSEEERNLQKEKFIFDMNQLITCSDAC